jgi:hypothetical protein
MVDVPDIGDLSPDEFLSRLETMRTELVAEMDDVLGRGDAPEPTAAALRELFEEYALGDEQHEPQPLVHVESDDQGRLVFSRDEAEAPVVLACPEDRWCLAGEPVDSEEAPTDEALALKILTLVPWWSEGAFVKRVGNPEAAAGRSLTDD